MPRSRWLLLAFLGCFVAASSGCTESEIAQQPEALTRVTDEDVSNRPEQLYEVQSRTWPSTVRVQGSLLGDEEAIISTKIAGRVESVLVDLGDMVSAGEPLVLLETSDLQLRVDQAEAQLAQACAAISLKPDQSELELDPNRSPAVRVEKALLDEARLNQARGEELVARRATSQQEIERLATLVRTAEARHAAALNGVQEKIALVRLQRAQLALAKQELADARIVAPFNAVVRQRQSAPGEYLQPAQAVVTLVRVDTLRFTAGVPERLATSIRRGQPVQIRVNRTGHPIQATITRLSPALDLASRSLTIEADVPNPDYDLRSGLFCEADIIVAPDTQVLAVPEGAVTEFAGVEKVWLVKDGQRSEKSIRTGRTENGYVEVLDGLSPGDVVINRQSDVQQATLDGQQTSEPAVAPASVVVPERTTSSPASS